MAVVYYTKTMQKEAFLEAIFKMQYGYLPKIYKDERGKPYLDNQEYISISHSSNYLAVAISDKNVGVDIQEICYREAILRIYADNEKIENARAFTRLWTMKESYGKYLGIGLNKRILATDFSKYLNDELFIFDHKYFCVREFDDFVCTICTDDDTIHYVCIGG